MELRRCGEASLAMSGGIIYVYEDGGKYCGEWEDDQAHGYGVCTGPRGMGTFEGLWERGDQVVGVFTWPTGQKYTGQWKQGLRDGLGKENKPDGTEYAGDFTRDLRGPFGVMQLPNGTVYSGSWSGGVQEGAGVESYSDGGVYRGQYKKGVRHGHGTRSSSAYETNPPSQDTPNCNPSDCLSKKISITSIGSTKWTSRPWMGVRPSDSAELRRDGGKLSASSSQIYEGEWKDDKRHGHGVLKVPGNYTYYGQWEQNMKTGYGVLVYEDCQREEGQWLNGKLVSILKRKKRISLQYRHLEGKVKQAYTLAIQAADMARTKAVLGESRASSASVKCRSAQKTAQQATKDAQVAKEKAEMHKSAPKLAEGLTSPLQTEFSSTNLWKMINESTSTDSPKLLQVNHEMPTSSSFEDITSVTKNDAPHSISSSSSSLNESESSSSAFDLNLTRHNQEDFRKEMEIHQRRSRFQHRSSSSSSKGSLDENVGASFNNSSPLDGSEKLKLKRQQTMDMLIERRRRPAPFHTSSGTDISLSHSHMMWGLPNHEEEEEEEEGGGKNDRVHSVVVDRELRSNARNTQHVDKTTGERCVGDASDDDSFEERKRAVDLRGQRTQQLAPPSPLRPLVTRSSVTFDMLAQMANWNKMVAYINFALLIFLLILILVFVMSIHFHFSSHSNVQQNPASFMNQMA